MTLFYIILSTLAVSIISFIGVFVFFQKKENYTGFLKVIISLAAGALLAVTFTDLLPEAIESGNDINNIFLTVLVSFLAFFILERFIHWHHCHCDYHGHAAPENKKNIIWTNLIGDGLHNIMDGFLIATAFILNPVFGVVTTVAVALHEIPQEIADFGVLLYSGLSRKKALLFNFLFALTAVVAGIVFYYFGKNFEHLIPYFAAFAAGNFIYLAAADLIPELHHDQTKKNILKHTLWLLVGVGIILAINFIAPQAHAKEKFINLNNSHVLEVVFGTKVAQAQTMVASSSIKLQATSSIPVDGLEVFYNGIKEFDIDGDESIDRLSYYLNDSLVLTTYDNNIDGIADLWLAYDENLNIIKEVIDTDGDEQFDLVIDIGPDGRIVMIDDLLKSELEINNATSEADTSTDLNRTSTDDTTMDIGVVNNFFSTGRVGIVIGFVIVFGLVFVIKRSRR